MSDKKLRQDYESDDPEKLMTKVCSDCEFPLEWEPCKSPKDSTDLYMYGICRNCGKEYSITPTAWKLEEC